jgi:hypothetical protein
MTDNFGSSSVGPASADVSSVEELAARVAETVPAPASRSEKVARAKRLIADPDYPSKEVLGSVAGLLARHLDPNGPS